MRVALYWGIFATLLIITGSAVACDDSEDNDDDSPSATSSTSEGNKSGPLGLQLDDSEGEVVAAWDDVSSASWYLVGGTARYGPTCELISEGVTESEDVDFSEKLQAGQASFVLPKPADDRLTIVLSANVTLEAHGQDDAIIDTDATSVNADPQC